jgi:glycosyltransferase involved in cell wall biosynthesis
MSIVLPVGRRKYAAAVTRPPLRLLLVINHLYLSGGAEIQIVHLAKGLAALGHRVTICCINGSSVEPATLERAGVGLVTLGASTRLGRPAAIPRLTRLARRADVVHCTMWDASLWGRIAAILAGRPAIVADHATDRAVQVAAGGAPRAAWIERHNRLLDRFTFATVACAESQLPVLTGEGVALEKIVHIPNGIPLEELARDAGGGPSREQLGLPTEAPLAMQVAVFRAEKNQVGALEAMARVRESLPDAQLAFVGDGDTRSEVEARAAALGASGWAHFLGLRGDVAAMLSLADLMLLPSASDAMPMTVLEAMALAVPILATDVGDVREVLGEAGVCVPVGDEDAFVAAAVRLLSDRALRDELGAAGPGRARPFDASLMARRYQALFEAATAGEAPATALARTS